MRSREFASLGCAAALVLQSGAVCAQEVFDPAAERLKAEIRFENSGATPDVLDEAIAPYFICMMKDSGAKLSNAENHPDLGRTVYIGDCQPLKVQAILKAEEILKKIPINSPYDRKVIVDNSLLAVDLMAEGMKKWVARAK